MRRCVRRSSILLHKHPLAETTKNYKKHTGVNIALCYFSSPGKSQCTVISTSQIFASAVKLKWSPYWEAWKCLQQPSKNATPYLKHPQNKPRRIHINRGSELHERLAASKHCLSPSTMSCGLVGHAPARFQRSLMEKVMVCVVCASANNTSEGRACWRVIFDSRAILRTTIQITIIFGGSETIH